MQLKILHLLATLVAIVSQASAKSGQNKSNQSSYQKFRGSSNTKLRTKVDNGGKKLFCYYKHTSQFREGPGKFIPEDIPPHLCTHIIYAYSVLERGNKLNYGEMNERLLALKHKNPKLKILLSLYSKTSFQTKSLQHIAGNRRQSWNFVYSTVTFLSRNNYDGLHLDWQYPKGGADRKNFVDLAKEFRSESEKEAQRSNKKRLTLMASLPVDPVRIRNDYDVPALAQYLDFMDVRAFGFSGYRRNVTGYNAPLFFQSQSLIHRKPMSVDYAAELLVEEGAPKEKLIIGIPTYGASFSLYDPKNYGLNAPTTGKGKAGAYTKEAGSLAYYEICEMLLKGARYVWDNKTLVPYLVQGKQWVSFDDERSIRSKMKWIKGKGYGGAAAWTLDYDDFTGKICGGNVKYPLISAMREELLGIPRSKKAKDVNWTAVTQKIRGQSSIYQNTQEVDCQGLQKVTFCNQLYICNGREMRLMACPKGLVFDSERDQCRRPRYVNGCH